MTRTSGMQGWTAKLKALQTAQPDRVAKALRIEAEVEMTEAKRRTPWDTTALRSTGHVEPVKREGRRLSVTLAFGTEYAIYVHEDLFAFHPHGQAKFLESTLYESRPYMLARLARRLELKPHG